MVTEKPGSRIAGVMMQGAQTGHANSDGTCDVEGPSMAMSPRGRWCSFTGIPKYSCQRCRIPLFDELPPLNTFRFCLDDVVKL